MMHCHQATRLLSESRERSLSLREKLAVRFHQSMCSGCRRFGRQVTFLGRAAHHYGRRTDITSDSEPDEQTPENKSGDEL